MKYWIAYKNGKILEQLIVAPDEEPRWSILEDFEPIEVTRLGDLNQEEYDKKVKDWTPSLSFAWANLKEKRDKLLFESDYPPLYERPESDQDKWRTYRQILRDLPQNTTNPFEPNWPTKP
jgi:hypothetical protein